MLSGSFTCGDVIFIRSKSPISWAIRKFTKSQWSHVAVMVSDNFLIESDFFKRVKVRRNKYKEYKIVQLNISTEERLSLVSFLLDSTNRKYDYGRILGILMYLIGCTKNRNLWDDYNKDICSELLVRGLTHLNSDNIPKRIIDTITPADIASVLLGEQQINT